MDIKKKLTLALLVASSLPLIIFTGISLNNSMQTAKETALSENLKRTEIVQEKINNFIDKNLYGVKVLSTNPSVRAHDAAGIKPLIAEAAKVYTDLNPIVVTGANGTQVARSDDLRLTNVSDRNFFKLAMQGQAEVISEVLVSKDNGHLISVLATPVTGSDGKVNGVIQGTVELSILNEFVNGLSQDQVTVYILDQEGKLLAHPTKDLQKPEERTDMSGFDFVQRGLAGSSGAEEVKIDNQQMLVSYMKHEKSGWLLCTEIPYSTAVAKSIDEATYTAFIGLFLIVVTGGIAFVLAGIAIKPILALVAAAKSVAAGNLSVKKMEIKSTDEIGLLAEAFNAMISNLTELIRKIQDNAGLVANSAEQLTANSEQSTQAANHIASSITEVAAGAAAQMEVANETSDIMEKLSAGIQQIAADANQVVSQSAQAADKAKNGDQEVEKAVIQMNQIKDTVNASAQVVVQLGERSKEIGQIVDTISGIAGQTNLLALNAAIEAARAGEQGRGFAVVAEEVRKLAEQSQEAAKKIAELIGEIQGETDKAVAAMNEGTQEVQRGTAVVNGAGIAFKEIMAVVTQVSDQVKAISASIQQMAASSQQTVVSVKKIDDFSKKSAGESQGVSAAIEEQLASMEEISAASQALVQLSQDLQAAVAKFRA
ncbi:methyl-accepting chemotaxis protein [Sporomusa termitida]|uniref:Methyl-accepting chemotaxis protein McpB n=1 Tax=Sporomusa termitida TaxID=2377 RepID=A0A517DR92_9FIRM|nr:methyl-accepting chemotaxis protein [Sporomusa termitida]QDR79884.1 Methyl-accepting chemotaxis protein McpB [Sporomusa termitida]